MTYSRAGSTTIGPGCLTAVFGMGTGVAIRVWSPGVRAVYQRAAVRVVSARARHPAGGRGALPRGVVRPRAGQGRINAVKRSAVSTGQLSVLLRLHTRPIDLVVFQEPVSRKGPEISSRGGFHA